MLWSGAVYAMKVLRKENVVKRKQVEHTKTERRVLGYTKHPFIVGLHYAFQTLDNLYVCWRCCAGGVASDGGVVCACLPYKPFPLCA